MPSVLIVEDQPLLLESLCKGLAAEGFETIGALNGQKAFEICESTEPDVMVLDLMLPDEDGLSLLEKLRKHGRRIPVLIVSARDSVDHRIKGLNMGADDYLTKPFVFTELLARVRAVLRRRVVSIDSTLSIDDIELDLVTRQVTQNGVPVELTARQFEVLAYLIRHQNQIVSREMLARDIWREETATWTNLIEVQVNRLRSKLDRPGRKFRLHTVRGVGYVLGDRPS